MVKVKEDLEADYCLIHSYVVVKYDEEVRMNRQLNLKIDIDSRKVTKYNDLIKVGDTVTLSITLISKGNTVILSGENVKLLLKKEDNKKVEQSVNVSGNTITCTLSVQATTTVGQVVGELTFTGSNTKLTSSNFIFNVEGSVSNEVLEQSKDDVEILNKITDSITKANNTVETYKNNINAVAGTTEAVAALTEMKGLLSKAETNNTNLAAANTQATKNIKALTELGDATNLAKDVEALKKQTLESNYTSIETDSVLTKLESVKDGFVDNMVIGGKTMQNVFSAITYAYRDKYKLTYTESSDIVTATLLSEVDCWTGFDSDINPVLKPNTTYTYVWDIFEFPNAKSTIRINFGEMGAFTPVATAIKGRNIGKFTTGDVSSIYFGMIIASPVAPKNSIFKFSKNVLVLEGDWTDKKIPTYFDGIKSVGESEFSDGKYPVNVKSIGNNLFDTKSLKSNGSVTMTTLPDGNMRFSGKSARAQITKALDSNLVQYLIGKQVSLSADFVSVSNESAKHGIFLIIYRQSSSTSYPNVTKLLNHVTTTIPIDTTSLVLTVNVNDTGTELSEDNIIVIKDIYLNIGIEAIREPYKEDTTKILLKEPLRGLPNGVKDTIDFKKGIITRNAGKFVLNGSESVFEFTNQDNTDTKYYQIVVNNTPSANKVISVLCDKFIAINGEDNWFPTNHFEGISGASENRIAIRILKSKLASSNIAGFKTWLQSNPTTVYYQLATPTTEKLEIKDTLQTFKDGYIQLENSITPVVNLDFSTNYPSIVASMKEKLDALMDRMATVEAYITEKASASIIENI